VYFVRFNSRKMVNR